MKLIEVIGPRAYFYAIMAGPLIMLFAIALVEVISEVDWTIRQRKRRRNA